MAVSQTRRARAARRRSRRVAAADNDLTLDEWQAIQQAWGACAYCGGASGSLQKDCVLPISRGGRYTFENVVPACRSCNASKSNDEVTGWLRRKRLDERAFLMRHVEILAAWRTASAAQTDEVTAGATATNAATADVADTSPAAADGAAEPVPLTEAPASV